MLDKKIEKNLIGIVILVFLVSIFLFIRSINQLPAPLFGGDLYYQLGNVNHIKYGGDLFSGSNILEGLPGYLPLYSIIVGLSAKVLNIDGITAMLGFSLIFSLLSIIVIFFASHVLFKNKILAILSTVLILTIRSSMIMKYSNFTAYIIFPIFFILLYKTLTEKNYKLAILTGIAYGLNGISHGIAFIAASLLLGTTFLYFGILKNLKNKERIKKYIKLGAIIFVIGFLISLLYWYKPLFVHQMQTGEHYLDWNNENFSDETVQNNFFKAIFKSVFFSAGNLGSIVSSILSVFGLIAIFLIKNKNKTIQFCKVFLATSAIGIFSYFLTRPLFNMDLYPVRMADFFIPLTKIILIGFGFFLISKKLKKFLNKKTLSIFILILLIPSVLEFKDYRENNLWAVQGKNEIPSPYPEMRDFIIQNTRLNDVFLSSNELSFGLNALTGRKLLVTRRAQNDPFLDMDSRVLASAAILYGNNNELREEKIKEYDIDYFYWDVNWIFREFALDENGNVINKLDPLVLFDTEENRKFLDDLEIEYYAENTWVDPALQGDEYKKFEILVILPKRADINRPWSEQLDNYLEEIWSYGEDTKISAVYRIKIN